MRLKGIFLFSVAAMAFSSSGAAQNSPPDRHSVYEAVFFDTFSPANALQMVERLPGFILDSGDMGVRGFGQAAGNVVINGRRPSSKSDPLAVVLSRIPASRVVRIELATGNSFGADYAGKPQVANVVLSDDGGLAGTLEAKLVREFTEAVLPTASASLLYRRGNSTFSGSVKLQHFAYSENGFDQLMAFPSHDILEHREVFKDSREPYKIASLGWSHDGGADRAANINAKISIDPWDIDQTSHIRLADGSSRDDLFAQRHTWKTYELSGDLTRPLLSGAIKLNILATRRDRKHDDMSAQYNAADLLGGIAQKLDDTLDERVVRLSWTRPAPSGWLIEFGSEAAFNRLETANQFYTIDAANVRTRVALPIDNAVVTEYRGELFANAGRDLSDTLHVDFGVTYEASRLTLRGDAHAQRSLQFLKPKASINWRPGDWHVQLSAQRSVAQLNFGDFVSGAEVNDQRVNGGNAELVPQRAWEVLLSADRKILGDGRLKIDLGYDRVSLVQDRIPVSNGFDAPGNLGSGSRRIARANLDLPTEKLGIKWGRLSLDGGYLDTSVRDPYTLRDRHFSGVKLWTYSASFRQDLTAFAWGVTDKGDSGFTSYRRNEADKLQGASPTVSGFFEYRPNPRLTATVGVENLFDTPAQRWRDMFTPDRSTLLHDRLEYRERNSHRLWYVSLKQSFG